MSSESTTERSQEGVLEVGTLIHGRYRIERLLAEGGMGRVYVAVQEPIGRRVALKVMRRELVSDELSVKRFLREARAVSKLHHPNTITVLDSGEAPGQIFYIAMELLEGESLHQLLRRQGRLPLGLAINIVGQIARSLAEAHSKKVIHRDLKPENIFISHVEGEGLLIKVLDFGIAKLQFEQGATRITRAGYVCGTPEYMSPEQARGDEIDPTSDLYSLAVILWEMLAGDVPFLASTPLGTVLKHQNDAIPGLPPEADATAEVDAFLQRAMAKHPANRPANAEVFLQELLEACPPDLDADLRRLSRPSVGMDMLRPTPMGPTTPPSISRSTQDVATAPTAEHLDFSDPSLPRLEAPPAPQPTPAPQAGLAPQSITAEVSPLSEGRRKGLGLGLGLLAAVALGGLITGVALMFGSQGGGGGLPIASSLARASRLKINASPDGVMVLRDGVSIGMAPIVLEGAPGTRTRIELRMNDYQAFVTTLTFPRRGEENLHFDLVPQEPSRGVEVALRTTPQGAMVVREGFMIANTPHIFRLRPEDEPFDVEVRLAGHQTQLVRVDPSLGSVPLAVQLFPADAPEREVQLRPADAGQPAPTVLPTDLAPLDPTDGGQGLGVVPEEGVNPAEGLPDDQEPGGTPPGDDEDDASGNSPEGDGSGDDGAEAEGSGEDAAPTRAARPHRNPVRTGEPRGAQGSDKATPPGDGAGTTPRYKMVD